MSAAEVPRGNALSSLAVGCLLDPSRIRSLSMAEWGALLPILRRNRLLGSFGERLASAGVLEAAPEKARRQLLYARIASESARTAVAFEASRMLRALRGYAGPLVLLKGAAYDFARLPPAPGRVSGDLDVMVPGADLDAVEEALLKAGWRSSTDDAYDQRYYREWAHEVPALLHPSRQTPIDLHHTITQPTRRIRPDAAALVERSVPTPTVRLRVLCPADMVVHAAIHLIDDEVAFPLRDLFDLHLLLDSFARTTGFWDDLIGRASLHGACRPLNDALTMAQRTFRTEVPRAICREIAGAAGHRLRSVLIGPLLSMRFGAEYAGSRRWRDRAVQGALLVRAHWLRMPPRLLTSHLATKTARRLLTTRGDARNAGSN